VHRLWSCNPYFGGYLFSRAATQQDVAAVEATATQSRILSPQLLPVSFGADATAALATRGTFPTAGLRVAASEKDATLAQKLGQLQLFTAVFPQECMGQLGPFGST
jgi:hypothetical protein